ncbi:MAG: metal-dependent hydrolase [Thermoplasmata archaeon]|nr:MAG: metal-dependent hydrolase [Thermoplasmata archaeon]
MFPLGHIGITIGIVLLITYYKTDWRIKFDIRWLALGAMLPDIIDKTIGLLILREYIDNGRIYSHTLLFAVILVTIAAFIRSNPTIALGFGSCTHIAFDRMWELPSSFLWPSMGWSFPRIDFTPSHLTDILFHDPYTIVSEILGALILLFLFFYFKLYRLENWRRLWRTGSFSKAS